MTSILFAGILLLGVAYIIVARGRANNSIRRTEIDRQRLSHEISQDERAESLRRAGQDAAARMVVSEAQRIIWEEGQEIFPDKARVENARNAISMVNGNKTAYPRDDSQDECWLS